MNNIKICNIVLAFILCQMSKICVMLMNEACQMEQKSMQGQSAFVLLAIPAHLIIVSFICKIIFVRKMVIECPLGQGTIFCNF